MAWNKRTAHRIFSAESDPESKSEDPTLFGGLQESGVTEYVDPNARETEIFVFTGFGHADEVVLSCYFTVLFLKWR